MDPSNTIKRSTAAEGDQEGTQIPIRRNHKNKKQKKTSTNAEGDQLGSAYLSTNAAKTRNGYQQNTDISTPHRTSSPNVAPNCGSAVTRSGEKGFNPSRDRSDQRNPTRIISSHRHPRKGCACSSVLAAQLA